jgi:hypothetical protein
MEKRICQNCKQDFIIESDDFDFYQKIKVPPPTWCPDCRLIRRFAYREDRSLYKDTCDLCKKDIVSVYAPGTPYTVYCSECWWGDKWDGTQYGRDYDFSKPFFEQLHELQMKVPCQASNKRNSINSDYCNGIVRCKNCTLVFGGIQSINCMYCQNPLLSRDSIDSDVIMNADHAYENLNSTGVFNTKFVYFSNECLDSSLLFNCLGCSNCFGCVNLRNQQYTIFNKKYSKEDYQKEIKYWDIGSYKILNEAKDRFLDLYYKTPRRFASIISSENVLGDDIENTKNCKMCFATRHGVENSKYIFLCGLLLKDSYDVNFGGDTSEILYEVTGSTQSQNTFFSRACNNAIDVEYSENIYGGQYLFGCVKLKQKKYCILNKQYTKEEYENLIPKIKQHMIDMPYVDKRGNVYKYGEFFPSEHSLWAYNESWAQFWFPLTKEEAIEQGYSWRDSIEKNHPITILPNDLPDHIKDVPDSILEEVIACSHSIDSNGILISPVYNEQCATAFRILPDELQFCRKSNIALPRMCPNCRYADRLKKRNPPKLWKRKCMCRGKDSIDSIYQNTTEHFHGDSPCYNEFDTAIEDSRKEIIYCEKCYQSEFI